MMKYIKLKEYGTAEQLTVAKMRIPKPGPGEVLIKVEAAGINRPDIMQRQGRYPAPVDASQVLGLEVAGEVAACGDFVDRDLYGQRVCALCNGGGYAEYVCVPAGHCLVLPESLEIISAAAMPEAMFTIWTNVFDRAGLKKGESILIHGGAGGIGHMAIQMALHWGADIYATAGTEEKCNTVSSLGAKAINYHEQDFVSVIKGQSSGVDVVLDIVGGDYIQRHIQLCRTEGRIINIAFQQSAKVEVDFMRLMLKRLHLSGSTLRSRSEEDKAWMANCIQQYFWPAVAMGAIKPIIHQVFDFHDVVDAHRLLESNTVTGKLVLSLQ